MAEPVRVRRLTDQEGQRLHQFGAYRRAMMIMASAGGNRVPVIAKLVVADEVTTGPERQCTLANSQHPNRSGLTPGEPIRSQR